MADLELRPPAPPAPTDLTATALGENRIQLQWTTATTLPVVTEVWSDPTHDLEAATLLAEVEGTTYTDISFDVNKYWVRNRLKGVHSDFSDGVVPDTGGLSGGGLSAVSDDPAPQLGGDLDLNGFVVQNLTQAHAEPSIVAGALTFDLGFTTSFTVSLTANVTSISLTNPPPSGQLRQVRIRLVQDGTGGRTVGGWPAGVKWPGGAAPTISSAAGATDLVWLETDDGGATWFALARQAFA